MPLIDKLISSSDPHLPQNFISAAVKLDQWGVSRHAGIIFSVNGLKRLFHFDYVIELESGDFADWYVTRDFETIPPVFGNAFLTHCTLIQRDTSPTFGYYYPGSYYKEGRYFSANPERKYMTCVGFCLNVINGFIEADQYLNFEDWNIDNFRDDYNYIQDTINAILKGDQEANIDEIKADIRRIMPDEYLASAFFDTTPITKESIDAIIAELRGSLRVLAEQIAA